MELGLSDSKKFHFWAFFGSEKPHGSDSGSASLFDKHLTYLLIKWIHSMHNLWMHALQKPIPTSTLFYTLRPFQRCENHVNQSLYASGMWKLCLPQVDLPCWPPWYWVNVASAPLLTHVWISMCGISRRSKTLTNWGLRNAKTLTLDDYQAMLNIGTLGWVMAPFFSIVLVPWLRITSRSGIWENNRGGRQFCSSLRRHCQIKLHSECVFLCICIS